MADLGNSKNIIVGAAAFYVSKAESVVADDGTITPALPTLTAGQSAKTALDASVDWRSVGYTENGVTVSYEPTYGDVTVDQLLDSALIFKSGMKVTINTTFAEATLENLVIVWGQADDSHVTDTTPDTDDTLTIDGGSLGDHPHERSLAFVGGGPRKAAGSTERVYNVGRAIQTQTTAHDLKRDAATTLPVSFRCLPGNDGKYGVVRERALS